MSPEPVEVGLVVTEVDLDDEATQSIIARELDDLLWSESSGVVTATVFAATDTVQDTLEAAARIHRALPEAQVVRVAPELVSISSIAARVGVTRQAVRQWVSSHSSTPFPTPFAVLEPDDKPMKIWRWAEVTPWLHEVKGLSFERLPTPPEVAAVDAHLAATPRPDRNWTPFGPAVLTSTTHEPLTLSAEERESNVTTRRGSPR